MFIEHRTYQLKTSAAAAYFELFGTDGLALQVEHLKARCVGHYLTEVGPLSQIIVIWEYESYESRLEGRRRLYADPRWRTIVDQVSPLIELIETKALTPSPAWTSQS